MASTEDTKEEGSGSILPSGPPLPTPTVTPERQITPVSVGAGECWGRGRGWTQLEDLSVWRKATVSSGSVLILVCKDNI